MRAFHNDANVKAKYVARLAAHRAAEQLIQGIGYDGTKGCAVGCTLNGYAHSQYQIELGLPEWLAYLEDCIFEGLPKGQAEQFAEDFLSSIPVGADVSEVRGKLAVLRHGRDIARLAGNKEPYAEACRTAVQLVIDWINTGGRSGSAAKSARSAAGSEAWSARSAAMSAAMSAESAESSVMLVMSAKSSVMLARSAAESAESAESAKWSAVAVAKSAEWSAAAVAKSAESARTNHFEWEAATLLQLLRNAPVARPLPSSSATTEPCNHQ